MKYSSFKKQQTLFENWRRYLAEALASAEAKWNPAAEDWDPPLDKNLNVKLTLFLDKGEAEMYPVLKGKPHGALSHAIKHYKDFTSVNAVVESACESARATINDWLKDNPGEAYIFDRNSVDDESAEGPTPVSDASKGTWNAYFYNNSVILNMFDMINDLKFNNEGVRDALNPVYNKLYEYATGIANAYVAVIDDLKSEAKTIPNDASSEEVLELTKSPFLFFPGTEQGRHANAYIMNFQDGTFVVFSNDWKYVSAYKVNLWDKIRIKNIVPFNRAFADMIEKGKRTQSLQDGRDAHKEENRGNRGANERQGR